MFKTQNAFEIFSLPVEFTLDSDALEQSYLALNQRYHPDRFAGGSSREKLEATLATTAINDAYETLEDSVLRGYHLLKILDPNNTIHQEQTIKDPELLMEAMEDREALEETSSLRDVQVFIECAIAKQAKALRQVTKAFVEKNLGQAALSLYRHRYYAKVLKDATEKLQTYAPST